MPVYEYRCVANGHQFDMSQPVGAEPPACPHCGSPTRKVYTSVGLIFKGPGFHVTDYRRPATADGKGGEKAETGPAADTAKPAGGDAGSSSPAKS